MKMARSPEPSRFTIRRSVAKQHCPCDNAAYTMRPPSAVHRRASVARDGHALVVACKIHDVDLRDHIVAEVQERVLSRMPAHVPKRGEATLHRLAAKDGEVSAAIADAEVARHATGLFHEDARESGSCHARGEGSFVDVRHVAAADPERYS